MIIEIKGLPEGQKVKHINVDITFEDSGTTITNNVEMDEKNETVQTNPIHPVHQPVYHPEPEEIVENEIEQEVDCTQPVHNIEEREYKDIPDEMKDLEF